MARRKYWLGSSGPFYYDDEKTRSDGSSHGIEFEEPPKIGASLAATSDDVITNAGTQIINGMADQEIVISSLTPLTVTAVDGFITISISGYTGTFTVPSSNTGMVFDLTYSEGVLQTVVERVEA